MSEKKGSLAAQAWNNTKADGDPDFGASNEPEFWGKLQFAANKVVETGTATTNFEKEVQRLHAAEKKDHVGAGEPLAVVDTPAAITAGVGGPSLTEKPDDASKAKAKPAKSKSAKETAKATKDQSGHVPKGKEAAAIVKEQANAPKHP